MRVKMAKRSKKRQKIAERAMTNEKVGENVRSKQLKLTTLHFFAKIYITAVQIRVLLLLWQLLKPVFIRSL